MRAVILRMWVEYLRYLESAVGPTIGYGSHRVRFEENLHALE